MINLLNKCTYTKELCEYVFEKQTVILYNQYMHWGHCMYNNAIDLIKKIASESANDYNISHRNKPQILVVF